MEPLIPDYPVIRAADPSSLDNSLLAAVVVQHSCRQEFFCFVAWRRLSPKGILRLSLPPKLPPLGVSCGVATTVFLVLVALAVDVVVEKPEPVSDRRFATYEQRDRLVSTAEDDHLKLFLILGNYSGSTLAPGIRFNGDYEQTRYWSEYLTTDGATVYPEPGLVMVRAATLSVVAPVAPVPPPVKLTTGAEV